MTYGDWMKEVDAILEALLRKTYCLTGSAKTLLKQE